ncbi:MAG: mannose-1-phosphate guanylyltransferase/mannose-6-phosphate isomerase [Pseudobdellovibrionaceae bacterium]
MTPVILSGGSGTRLWPISRQKWPKQFCHLFSESLQTLTLKRLQSFAKPWIVTSESLQTLTEIHLQNNNLKAEVIYEPVGKNTAPAIALLCRQMQILGQTEEVVAILPADHLIQKENLFLDILRKAAQVAAKGAVVTLGIEPSYPETGYGYIQIADGPGDSQDVFSVVRFHEKPNLETAQQFLQSGQYKWNAGIFVFKVQTMIDLFIQHQPEIWSTLQQYTPSSSPAETKKNLTAIYSQLPSISIDYAIMEKLNAQNLYCIPCDIGWSDVGSWDALADLHTTPVIAAELNSTATTSDPTQAIQVKSKNNFIHGLPEKIYSFVGIDDVIVVDTKDALAVIKKGQSQNIREVVEQLKKNQDPRLTDHTFEQRPWGTFEILKDTENFKSKVISVRPHSQISYQSHNQREEHWIITKGVGEVVLNDAVLPVQAGTHIHIPLKAKHRIRNTGAETLEFVEVQLGSYFGEDDITRYQDDYQRI